MMLMVHLLRHFVKRWMLVCRCQNDPLVAIGLDKMLAQKGEHLGV
jgi:hypothetical protein